MNRDNLIKAFDTLIDINKEITNKFSFLDEVLTYDYLDVLLKALNKMNLDEYSKDLIIDFFIPVIDKIKEDRIWFCHGDAHYGNFLISRNKIIIIDFEKSFWGNRYYDLAFFIQQPNVIKEEEWKEFIREKFYDFDEEMFNLTSLYVSFIILSRSSRWYKETYNKYYYQLKEHFKNIFEYYINKTDLKNKENILRIIKEI